MKKIFILVDVVFGKCVCHCLTSRIWNKYVSIFFDKTNKIDVKTNHDNYGYILWHRSNHKIVIIRRGRLPTATWTLMRLIQPAIKCWWATPSIRGPSNAPRNIGTSSPFRVYSYITAKRMDGAQGGCSTSVSPTTDSYPRFSSRMRQRAPRSINRRRTSLCSFSWSNGPVNIRWV